MSARFKELFVSSFLIRKCMRSQRRMIVYGMLCLLAVNLLEASLPLLIKAAIDDLVAVREVERIWRYGALYFGIALIQAVLRYGWRITLYVAGLRSEQTLRSSLLERFALLRYPLISKHESGELLALSSNDIPAVRESIDLGVLYLFDFLLFGGAMFAAMLWLSPALSAVTVVPLLFIPLLIARMEGLLKDRYQLVQHTFGRLMTLATEALRGVRVLKAFVREEALANRFQELSKVYVQHALVFARTNSLFHPTLELTARLGVLVMVVVGGLWVIDGSLTVGSFVAFQRYLGTLLWPAMALGMAVTTYQKAFASSERLVPMAEAAVDRDAYRIGNSQPSSAISTVCITNLTFCYPGSRTEVLRHVGFDLHPGERVALLGPVGSGKSTLVSILSGLYADYQGQITINGRELRDLHPQERVAMIAAVPQDTFLFGLSIGDNLSLGSNREATADDVSELQRVCSLAEIDREIGEFPGGFSTVLGERGVTISGGQRQRIALARALLSPAPFLVLDDALSAVDFTTEASILRNVSALFAQKTVLIVSHRLSTIQSADRVVVLSEEGAVSQIGTPEELIADQSGWFFRFCEQQTLEQAIREYQNEG